MPRFFAVETAEDRAWLDEKVYPFLTRTPTGCHEWQRATDSRDKPYGIVCQDGKNWKVHRVVYIDHFGPIPDGLFIDHLCRNMRCANPDHLELVTSGENTRRGEGPTAIHAAKTACIHGHEYTPQNTYLRPNGGRACRTCTLIRKGRAHLVALLGEDTTNGTK